MESRERDRLIESVIKAVQELDYISLRKVNSFVTGMDVSRLLDQEDE